MDQRFAVIVQGTPDNALNQLGVSWWYSYGQSTPSGPGNGVAQISINPTGQCCVRVPVATLQAGARAHPGAAWIIGNEPNVGGQDSVSPGQYATELQYYVTTIKGADPTAQIVGPNVLNWDSTCVSGCGFTQGHGWVDQFRSAWATQYGGEPPLDIWGIHTYAIDWYNTPMTNATDIQTIETDLTNFSTYLSNIPADASKPLWLTEYGIIWAYQGWTFVSGGCAVPPYPNTCFAPTGNYDTTGVANFVSQVSAWLATNSQASRYKEWYLYISYGSPEPYSTTYTGISLLTGLSGSATLSQFGQEYQQLAHPTATVTSALP